MTVKILYYIDMYIILIIVIMLTLTLTGLTWHWLNWVAFILIEPNRVGLDTIGLDWINADWTSIDHVTSAAMDHSESIREWFELNPI